MNRPRWIPLALTAACYVLALVQRPGDVYADTKIDLYVDPQGFLADVASAWTGQIQLGHVFGGQYGGYLFPMAPWFAAGDALGIPTWIVHRLWLGTVLALAAWGVVRLLDALLDRPRGAPHVAAAVLFVLNPYVAVYANRTSITLLAYAALPWLLLAVHRGLRDPRGWRWPALFALVLTCTGGGVNVAVTGWVLLGPALFVLYERWFAGLGPGAIRPFLVRLVPVVLAANLWWLVPVVVHAGYGLDFLPFTEQPGTIWQTTSITESLRLTGFWTSYIGLGFGGEVRPYASHGGVLLFHWPVVVASLLVPALVLGGFAWTRRWRYGPWFLLLALGGLLVMVAGFPDGTPLRRALTFTYNEVQPVQFLRTTYKAGPLLALGLACLGGAAFAVAWDRIGRWVAVPLALLVALAAWPLTTGRAPERQLVFDVPAWWHAAEREVDALPAGERAMVLPGRLFAYYDWGGTIDPILPALASRPVAERMIVPFSDLRAVDLQFATDALISQERLAPGQLPPLLDLMGVGTVISPSDDDRSRSGAMGPVEADDVLAREPAFARTSGGGPAVPDAGVAQGHGADAPHGLGPQQLERAAAGRVRADERLPRLVSRPTATGGMVRLLPREPLTVVDGGAEGIAAMAAFGALPRDAPVAYAADVDAEEIRGAGQVVVTDTNRRQAFVAARLKANRGFVLEPDQSLSQDGAMLDPFAAGPDAQTVQRLTGVASVRAPFSPQTSQFPEHRPFAAIDGDRSTAWLADRALARSRHHLTVELDRPRRIGAIEVLPYDDERGRVLELEVNGKTVRPRGGWTRVPVAGEVERVRVAIKKVSQPPGVSGGAGGIAELRIPGVRARETLRPPVLAERALDPGYRGALSYLFSRFTVDAPHRAEVPVGPFQSYRLRDRVDPEPRLVRTIAPPVARDDWSFDAWTSPDPRATDAELDRMAGTTGALRATSSGRFAGLAAHRASRAFDGDPRTAWIAPWVPTRQGGAPRPESITVELRRPATVRRLRLVAPRETVRVPLRVIVNDTAASVDRGVVALPEPITAQRFTITVEQAVFRRGTSGRERQRRAVGIAEIEGIPGARVRDAGGALRGRCGDATVRTAGGVVALRVEGDVAALERGDPLRAGGCSPVGLPAGRQDVAGGPGPLRVDQLALRSEAGRVDPRSDGRTAPRSPGRVVDPGRDDQRGARDDVRLDVRAPAWLVLGEGYNRGWRATCDGEDLGEPTPLQGFANAWRVGPGCTDVAFAWAPNKLLGPAYLISLIACLALLAVLLLARRRPADPPRAPVRDPGPPVRLTPGRAVAFGVLAGAVLGFVFALRAGVVLGPIVAFILWRGLDARRLSLIGAGLLGVVAPILYVAVPVRDPGGFNTNLAVERIAAHWVGVAAIVCLGAALWRTLAAARAPAPDHRPDLPRRRRRGRADVA